MNKSFLASEPGIKIIKKGEQELVDLEATYQCPGLVSRIIDLPVTDSSLPLTLGRFEMRPSVDFPFFYESLEVKTVITGRIVVRDEDGVLYEALPGDVLIFTPPTLVMFCAESDGEAVFIAHRLEEPSFLPGFDRVIETPIPEKVRAWWKKTELEA